MHDFLALYIYGGLSQTNCVGMYQLQYGQHHNRYYFFYSIGPCVWNGWSLVKWVKNTRRRDDYASAVPKICLANLAKGKKFV